MSKAKPAKSTTPPPVPEETGLDFQLRVCAEHWYPVGLISETSRTPFVCLLKFHRMDIEATRCIGSNLTRLLPRLMVVGNGAKRP
jgi:hypothetical protein